MSIPSMWETEQIRLDYSREGFKINKRILNKINICLWAMQSSAWQTQYKFQEAMQMMEQRGSNQG